MQIGHKRYKQPKEEGVFWTNIQIIAFTERGIKLCAKLTELLNKKGYDAFSFCKDGYENLSGLKVDLNHFTKNAFQVSDCLIFIGAAGIAVRAVAPFLTGKEKDPGVLVIDEKAKYVIPILSGHIGGANKMAQEVAALLQAEPVLTTATDINGLFAVDTWASENDCRVINPQMIKMISSSVLKGEKIGFCCDFPIEGKLPNEFYFADEGKIGVSISFNETKTPFETTLKLKPKTYCLGIGSKKNAGFDELEAFFLEVLSKNQLLPEEFFAAATIDLKKDEPAILALCRKYNLKLQIYTPRELLEVDGEFAGSEFVKFVTGVDNVCERAAKKSTNGEIIMKKTTSESFALSIARKGWVGKF